MKIKKMKFSANILFSKLTFIQSPGLEKNTNFLIVHPGTNKIYIQDKNTIAE